MRADSALISLSIMFFAAAMLVEGLLFLPIASVSLTTQFKTFETYLFIASLITLAVVGITSVFKRKF